MRVPSVENGSEGKMIYVVDVDHRPVDNAGDDHLQQEGTPSKGGGSTKQFLDCLAISKGFEGVVRRTYFDGGERKWRIVEMSCGGLSGWMGQTSGGTVGRRTDLFEN